METIPWRMVRKSFSSNGENSVSYVSSIPVVKGFCYSSCEFFCYYSKVGVSDRLYLMTGYCLSCIYTDCTVMK